MARVIGGVGTSHVPALGMAIDKGTTQAPQWKPIFDGYERAREWVREVCPDVVIVVYNDHGSAVSLDMLPTFAIGVAAEYKPADEGWGPRSVPAVAGDVELSWHLAESLINEQFDMTVCQRLDVDHGLTVPLSILWGPCEAWPVRVVPIAVNVIQYPLPSPARCYALGQALRRAISSWEPELNVLLAGTGGMSHQLQGARAGLINTKFDKMFLEKIATDPRSLSDMSITDYIREAGSEGAELIMWLIMRGALGDAVDVVHSDYHVPASNTAAGIVVLQEFKDRDQHF